MQPSAFLAQQRRAHDELGNVDEISEFDEIVADPIVAVELVDFLFQEIDAVLRALQSLAGSHDADVVPHESSEFIPVVRDDDVFVRVGHLAFVPLGHIGRFERCVELRANTL